MSGTTAGRPRPRGRPASTHHLMEELAWQLDCHEGQGAILHALGLDSERSLYNACLRVGRVDLWRRFTGDQGDDHVVQG